MENREQQILSEIRQTISALRQQLDALSEQVELLAEGVDNESFEDSPIDLGIVDILDDVAFDVTTVEPVIEEPVPEDADELVIEEPVQDTVEEIFAEEPADEPEDVEKVAVVRPAVIDAMTTREAWRTDMPGSPVKDIRSAISLNDRILFINVLFDEDPLLFQTVLTRINSMSGLDEVVSYLREERPAWDMESDEVYRFMMAVRRRIR